MEKCGPLQGKGAGEAWTALLADFARGTERVVGDARLFFLSCQNHQKKATSATVRGFYFGFF